MRVLIFFKHFSPTVLHSPFPLSSSSSVDNLSRLQNSFLNHLKLLKQSYTSTETPGQANVVASQLGAA